MSGGFQFYDIIIFALIAVFIILRLRAVLGRRTGHERPGEQDMFSRTGTRREQASGDVVPMPRRTRASESADDQEPFGPEDDDIDEVQVSSRTGVKAGITLIRVADPEFSAREFLQGARAAFGMIVEAFAEGDTPTLRPLLGDDVYDEFAAAIRDRMAAGNTSETTIVSLDDVGLASAEMRGSTARIAVKFVSQQINVTRDADDEVVDGDPEETVQVTDIWTFARNTRSSNPNWMLVETRAE